MGSKRARIGLGIWDIIVGTATLVFGLCAVVDACTQGGESWQSGFGGIFALIFGIPVLVGGIVAVRAQKLYIAIIASLPALLIVGFVIASVIS